MTHVGSAGYVVPAINEIFAALLALRQVGKDPHAISHAAGHLEAATDKLTDLLKAEYGTKE